MPILSPELVSFLEGPNSIMVASRDAALVPALARVVAMTCEPDGDHVTVMVPDAAAARVLAQLRADGRVAVVSELSSTHRTIQVKGRAVAITSTPADLQPLIETRVAAFAAHIETIGIPRVLTFRIVRWPCTSVRIKVEQVFDQSPGPGAGAPLASPAPPPSTPTPSFSPDPSSQGGPS
jgi:hypothetical protein